MDPETGSRALPLEVVGRETVGKHDSATPGKGDRTPFAKCFGICCGCSLGLIIWAFFTIQLFCWTGWAAGTLSWLRGTRPPLSGNYNVGTIRGRLPAAGERTCGLYAQLHYPVASDGEPQSEFEGQYFTQWRDIAKARYFSDHQCLGEALLGDLGPMDPPVLPLHGSYSPGEGWPIVLYSSGLYGGVEYYQQFCRDMASTGKIVIALEHEAGAGTYATDCDGNEIFYREPTENDTTLVGFRRPQLDQRKTEYDATVLAVQRAAVDVGPVPSPIEAVLRTGNADKMILTGHSFGGCSAFYYLLKLAQDGIPTPFIGSILLDMWTGPLTEADYSTPVQEPLVMMTSDRWAWSSLIISRIMEINSARALAGIQVVGTVHDWISEDQFLMQQWLERSLPTWESRLGRTDVVTAFRETMKAVEATHAAFLNPLLAPDLNDTLLAMDPAVIKQIWDGVSS